MRLVADESVDLTIVRKLEGTGVQVYSVLENCAGITDDDVLRIAAERQVVLLTEDKDFGELTIRFGRRSCGIILLRANDKNADERFDLLSRVIANFGEELRNLFLVIDSNGTRIRELNHKQ